MLKRVAVIAAALIAVLALVIATRPAHLHVERSLAISAPPALVFPLINDFHAWASWSPWEKLDPNMKREISGAPQGKGARAARAPVRDGRQHLAPLPVSGFPRRSRPAPDQGVLPADV